MLHKNSVIIIYILPYVGYFIDFGGGEMVHSKRKIIFGVLIVIAVTLLTIGCSEDKDTSQVNTDQTAIGAFNNLNEESFEPDNIMDSIRELASEKYKGRLAGTKENELATEYIAKYFKKVGLENPEGLENYKQIFTQKVLMNNNAPKLEILDASGKVKKGYNFLDNFRVHTVAPNISINGKVTAPCYVIEDSTKLSDENKELNGKVLLIPEEVKNEIGYGELVSFATSKKNGIKGMVWEEDIDSPNRRLNHFVVSPYVSEHSYYRNEIGPIIFRCDSSTFKELCEASNDDLNVSLKVDYSVEEVQAANVIGLIPGTDDALKEEFIILTAHFDHVGDNKNGTYNPGALDNGSGTAALMEMARILKDNELQPKRPILFIAFNGEEEGLYGSKHFAYNTIYDIKKDKTVVINMDMIGSKEVMPLSIATDSKQESELRDSLYKIAKELGIDARKSSISGSDHAPFARRGIDAVCLIHEDFKNGYHSPGDTIETVDKDRINEVLRLVLYYIDKKAY